MERSRAEACPIRGVAVERAVASGTIYLAASFWTFSRLRISFAIALLSGSFGIGVLIESSMNFDRPPPAMTLSTSSMACLVVKSSLRCSLSLFCFCQHRVGASKYCFIQGQIGRESQCGMR